MTASAGPRRRPAADPAPLAAEIRRRLGPTPERRSWPPVSIVVLNRDGATMLRRLLAGLIAYTDYPDLELIVVDNGSRDESLQLLRTVEAPFPVSLVANPCNESFSDGCNQGAALARGELLLFLNNDVEPFEPGWLRELVACLRESAAGAVAATLLCPEAEHEASFGHGFGVQHRGLAFREEEGMLHPALHGWEADPLDERLGEDIPRAAVAAACVLLARDAFDAVGGFARGYVYGVEDVDLCLKLRDAGLDVLCSGRSIAIHHPVSTRRRAPIEEERARKLANRRLLWERWGPQLRREYELDRLEGAGLWAAPAAAGGGEPAAGRPTRAEVAALGFCLKAADPTARAQLEAVHAELGRRGHRCLLLVGAAAEDPLGLNQDVAVHLRTAGRYAPKPAQLNVLWDAGRTGPPAVCADSRYDLVLSGREAAGDFAARLPAAVEARIPEVGYRRRLALGPSPLSNPGIGLQSAP